MNFDECVSYTIDKHKEQIRKHGEPYYTHPLSVALTLKNKGFSLDYQIAGLFHDLLEDTDASKEEILNLSSKEVLDAVILVTKEEGYTMNNYSSRIKENDMALMVKLADRIDNLNDSLFLDDDFKKRYVKDTEEWYVDMACGTIFEDELNDILDRIKKSINY